MIVESRAYHRRGITWHTRTLAQDDVVSSPARHNETAGDLAVTAPLRIFVRTVDAGCARRGSRIALALVFQESRFVVDIASQITSAFHGVRLDGGISLRQGEALDNHGRGVTKAQYRRLPPAEIVDDWAALPLEELERYPHLAHLDAVGFRYYIPAFMLSILNAYDNLSMRVIATIGALYPRQQSGLWEHSMQRYALLDDDQKTTIARYLTMLPSLVPLDSGDEKRVNRALRNYWHTYLDAP